VTESGSKKRGRKGHLLRLDKNLLRNERDQAETYRVQREDGQVGYLKNRARSWKVVTDGEGTASGKQRAGDSSRREK